MKQKRIINYILLILMLLDDWGKNSKFKKFSLEILVYTSLIS